MKKREHPFDNVSQENYDNITQTLINDHPLDEKEIVDAVLEAWRKILITKIGDELQIGVDIFPSPQILGNYLHELIPVILAKKHPDTWRRDKEKKDKDLIYIPDNYYSVEIKTSSNAKNIYGNRSYGQETEGKTSGKKKYGFYITVNFEKLEENNTNPKIKIIRFGWLDHDDWKAQAAATGQQATLDSYARDHKLKTLYSI